MNYWRPNFCVLLLSTEASLCAYNFLGYSFQKGKSACRLSPSFSKKRHPVCIAFATHTSRQQEQDCLGAGADPSEGSDSVVPGCHLLPESTPGELGQPLLSFTEVCQLPQQCLLSSASSNGSRASSSAPPGWAFLSLQPGSDPNLSFSQVSEDGFPCPRSVTSSSSSCCVLIQSCGWQRVLQFRDGCSCCHVPPPRPRRQLWLLTKFCLTPQVLILNTLQAENLEKSNFRIKQLFERVCRVTYYLIKSR